MTTFTLSPRPHLFFLLLCPPHPRPPKLVLPPEATFSPSMYTVVSSDPSSMTVRCSAFRDSFRSEPQLRGPPPPFLSSRPRPVPERRRLYEHFSSRGATRHPRPLFVLDGSARGAFSITGCSYLARSRRLLFVLRIVQGCKAAKKFGTVTSTAF